MPTPSPAIVAILATFAPAFSVPTFAHAQVLVYGTLLAVGRRTVTAALRAVGLAEERHFTTYHRVLNRAVWSPLTLSRLLLGLLVGTFLVPGAPLVVAIDETLERRWGKKIAYKGRFRDAVRSRGPHVVTSPGVQWLCVMLLVPVPWSRRPWACPFLTVPALAPCAGRFAHPVPLCRVQAGRTKLACGCHGIAVDISMDAGCMTCAPVGHGQVVLAGTVRGSRGGTRRCISMRCIA